MARHRQPPQPRARGKAAVGQWILLIIFGLASVLSGCFFISTAVLIVKHGFAPYAFPSGLGLGLCILFAILARNRIYRLTGKDIPEGHGGGGFYG